MPYLGIDWATEKHDLCLLADDGRILSEFTIAHDIKGFQSLQLTLHTLGDVKINIERSDGLLVDWLLSEGYSVYVTSPNVLAHRRPRRSKDDRGDAYLLAYLLYVGEPESRPLIRQSPIVQHLKQLCASYDFVLRQQRQTANRLTYILRQYYPVILKTFRVPTALACLAFLEAYPTPQNAQQLTQEQFVAFLKSQRYSHMYRAPHMYAQLQKPTPKATVVDGYVTSLRILLPTLRSLHQERIRLIRQINKVFNTHPEAAWWRSIPGAGGPLTAARLLAWIGDDRRRFPRSEVLQAVAGTVPITRRSGKQRTVEFRRACSHPLRKVMADLAHQSVTRSGWAYTYFHDQLASGHSRPRAYRALANRWLRIIWKLWQTCEPYNEAKHVANRANKGMSATGNLVS